MLVGILALLGTLGRQGVCCVYPVLYNSCNIICFTQLRHFLRSPSLTRRSEIRASDSQRICQYRWLDKLWFLHDVIWWCPSCGDTGRWIYLYCHSALAEEQLPAGVSCCASLLTTPYGAHEGELSVALYVRNYVHQTPPHHTSLDHLTSYPLLCICYFIIQLILYNVVRRRNFTQV